MQNQEKLLSTSFSVICMSFVRECVWENEEREDSGRMFKVSGKSVRVCEREG